MDSVFCEFYRYGKSCNYILNFLKVFLIVLLNQYTVMYGDLHESLLFVNSSIMYFSLMITQSIHGCFLCNRKPIFFIRFAGLNHKLRTYFLAKSRSSGLMERAST